MKSSNIAAAVELVYKDIESRLPQNMQCRACGKCCDFKNFGHRLYVTTPELIYFKEKVSNQFILEIGRAHV